MEQLELYNRIFMETFSLSEQDLNNDVAMGSINDWDSVGHVGLITTIEDEFNLMFETEDILNFTSYEKGKEIMKKYGVEL